jgi:hypothetical protein
LGEALSIGGLDAEDLIARDPESPGELDEHRAGELGAVRLVVGNAPVRDAHGRAELGLGEAGLLPGGPEPETVSFTRRRTPCGDRLPDPA